MPFLMEGIKNDEVVLWTIPETLDMKDAETYLRKTTEDTDHYIKKNQISIRKKEDTYLKGGVFSVSRTMKRWAGLEVQAAQKGFKGIRVAGDGSWALENHWLQFLAYEQKFNDAVGEHKWNALCSYSMKKVDIKKVYDIGTSHQSSIVKQMGRWNSIELATFKKSSIW